MQLEADTLVGFRTLDGKSVIIISVFTAQCVQVRCDSVCCHGNIQTSVASAYLNDSGVAQRQMIVPARPIQATCKSSHWRQAGNRPQFTYAVASEISYAFTDDVLNYFFLRVLFNHVWSNWCGFASLPRHTQTYTSWQVSPTKLTDSFSKTTHLNYTKICYKFLYLSGHEIRSLVS